MLSRLVSPAACPCISTPRHHSKRGAHITRRTETDGPSQGTIGGVDGLPTLRSAGVGVLLAVQDPVQRDTLYSPRGRRLITRTAQTHISCAGVGQDDAAWVSTRLGTATVVGRGASAGRNRDELLGG